MITHDLDTALNWLAEKAEKNSKAKTILNTIQNGKKHSNTKSLKSWLENFDAVDTLQITVTDDTVVKVWHAGIREVNLSHSTYAEFDGSRRDYSGVVTVSSSDDFLIAYDKSMNTFLIYLSTY